MPPKAMFNKKELLEAGLVIIKKNGFENVNARNLARELSCSTNPIFRIYKDMNEMKADLFSFAETYCNEYIEKFMSLYPQNMVYGMGMAYIEFARQEANVFKFLFMSNQFKKSHAEQIWNSEENVPILHGLAMATEISFADAQSLIKKLWLLTHGIASMIAANGQLFTTEDVTQILSEAFTGFLIQIKQKDGT